MQCRNTHKTLDMSVDAGMSADITGFVSRYNTTYQIAPRTNEDVEIINGIEIYNNENFVVFPNPATHQITVDVTDINALRIELISSFEQVLFHKDITESRFSISLEEFAAGVYFVKLTTVKGQVIRKVIKN